MKLPSLTVIGFISLIMGSALIITAHLIITGAPAPQVLWNILRDLGITLAGTGIVVVTVDRGTATHIKKQMTEFIDQLRGDVIFARFARIVPEEIADEISLHVIEDRILYRRFHVDNTFRESVGSEEILEGDSVAQFEVVNDSDDPSQWKYHMRISDLANGIPRPNTVVQFTVESRQNSDNQLNLNETELSDIAEQTAETGVLALKKTFDLLPHEVMEVQIVRRIRVKRRDTYNLTVRHPTVDGMQLKAYLPVGYKVDCRFAHPGEDDGQQCTFRSGNGNVVTAAIRGGILPYQGITMSWDPPKEPVS